MAHTIQGNLVDVIRRQTYPASLTIEGEKIISVEPLGEAGLARVPYILPGFIDAHVHIESSMLTPAEFARLAVVHGTVATVSDPHEIANVCGLKGVEFMITDGRRVPFKFNFGAPSCVPATPFETAGAELNADDVASLLAKDEIRYLSEMMNFPGVLSADPAVMKKIAAAKKLGKPIDGHAPGLRGDEARRYIAAGISTDHECFTKEEALDKLACGMKIIIREGSAARNFDALIDLLHDHEDDLMFCSDDKHPDSLVAGHIDLLCARAAERGIDYYKILKAACVNPVRHYRLDCGLLRVGDAADLILVEDLKRFRVLKTFVDGKLVAENGETLIKRLPALLPAVNKFSCGKKAPEAFRYDIDCNHQSTDVPVIEALDGQLITKYCRAGLQVNDRQVMTDPASDILKIAVVNRYSDVRPAIAFVKNFGLKRGAIASTVAHDSHNIVAVGADDDSICHAVNLLIELKGGVSCVDSRTSETLALPVGGLMSNEDGYEVARSYLAIDAMAKGLGSSLSAPFMTLSFMALLVIPHLKLSDKGLFDVDRFDFVSV
ncbi:MAG TPA: adenine deaminase [Puia sp.]|nr:adenine deaminase [Puia sp.]